MKKKTIIYTIIIVLILTLIPIGSYYGFNCLVSKEDKAYIDKLNDYVTNSVATKGYPSEVIDSLGVYKKDLFTHQFSKKAQKLTYNQENSMFGILNPFGSVSYPKEANSKDKNNLWIFIDNEKDLSDKYSNYLLDDFNEDGDNRLSICTGLDVGNNNKDYNIDVYHKKEHNNVKLATINGNLYFKNGTSKFEHYGNINEVIFSKDIVYRYIEYGRVNFMDIYSGNIELKRFSVVNKIYVNKVNVQPFIYLETFDSIFSLGKEEGAIIESNKTLPFIEKDKEEFKK